MNDYQEHLLTHIQDYPKRFLRRDKERFLTFLESELADLGYETRRQEGKNLLRCVNLETANDEADVILLAHYDTPTIIPPVMEPLVRLTGHTRQLLLVVVFILLLEVFEVFEHLSWVSIFQGLFWLSFLSLLIPNPKNFNDNTSGVLGLLFLAAKISHDDALRNRVKFVFLDNEENGLLGAGVLRNSWRSTGFDFDTKPIISLDCIGRGKIPVMVRNGKTTEWSETLFEHLQHSESQSRYLDMAFIPINDNFIFRREGAVVITRMNRSLIPGGYYIDNIHSPLDNHFEPEKIDWVAERIWAFLVGLEIVDSGSTIFD